MTSLGSVNNKANRLRMGNVIGRKFYGEKKEEEKKNKVEEFQLANLVSLGSPQAINTNTKLKYSKILRVVLKVLLLNWLLMFESVY